MHRSYFGPPLRLAGARAASTPRRRGFRRWCAPALALLNRIGVDGVYAHDVDLANRFRAGLGMQPSNSATSPSRARDGAAGNVRTAIDLTATVDRRDFAMDWQAPLPNGGDVLGWEVAVDIRAEFVQARSGGA